MKKPMKRLFCMLLAALMTVSIIAVAPGGAETAEAATLSELQDQAAVSKARLSELKKQLSELQRSKADALAQKNVLDEQNNLLQSQIDNASAQITALESELAENQKKEEAQYELFCEQVRSEEERGSLSYLSVLFKATSMADLLNRMEFVNEVAEYNKTLIAAMKETRENIKAEKTEMEAKEAQLGEQQGELQGKLDETTKLMNEYAADQRELERLYAAEEAAGKAIVAEINRLMAESDVVPSAEGFIWPVTTSKMISSPQGNRVSPGNGIGSSNHKGVDICNVSYSSKIYATKSGKVLIASMPYSDKDGGSSGYGNYVVIDHGGGMSTLYAHMSIVKVSVGQYVSQGDVIGVTGNTGASTGPHLHYEVHSTTMVNGRAVTVYENPLNYLPGYIAAW